MGDRANIYLEMPTEGGTGGVYLYTHWSGYLWPEALREALKFGQTRWSDPQYLARVITSRVFENIADQVTGGGLSLILGDNEHPIIIADLVNREVSFSDGDGKGAREERYGHRSFSDYVAQEHADYPSLESPA